MQVAEECPRSFSDDLSTRAEAQETRVHDPVDCLEEGRGQADRSVSSLRFHHAVRKGQLVLETLSMGYVYITSNAKHRALECA